nr:Ig-like domain-containing protein [Leucobacter luti]
MLWTIPDGTLIPLSQWNLADPPQEVRGAVVVEDVPEQVPPTAVDDAFGARPGEPAALPVLLNDFDANSRDVLTIVPESLSESPLPRDFGTLELLPDRQTLVVQPESGAQGSATFTYRISDGALESETATVTVRIAADDENSAPEWCPVTGCQRAWGVPDIVPGGTLVTPLLEGWVDPEGDVMTLASVVPVRGADPVRALVTAEGDLAVRHTDPTAGPADIALRVTVRDSRGAEQDRKLTLAVRPDALPIVTGTAASAAVGTPTTLTPLDRVSGGSGSFVLVDVAPQTGAATATTHPISGAVEVLAPEAGVSTFVMTVRDAVTGAESTGALRVTATAAGAGLALPPLRAYVRPLADTTVEVLAAIPGAASRALAVTAATVTDGDLRADVVEHSRVRVAGATADGGPGRIGSADITVSEGTATARGRITVFQAPESSGSGVIAVADTATVRAGSAVDIRVLDNDVSAPGERLLLHPEVTGSGTDGELAFAAGGTLRYLAPATPGTYRVGYTAYAASAPELSDTGEVIVTVVPSGNNREPQPATLTARVTPGGSVTVPVPRSGVDPDGDRVRVRGVGAAENALISASVAPTGTGIDVSAAVGAEPGTATLRYTVTDDHGGTGTGTLYVMVTGDGSAPPVTGTDQVRLTPGSESVVLPLDNDIDPAGGELSLVEVVPNVPGDADSAEYRRLAAGLDTEELRQGRIRITAGEDLGTVSYRYTVRSTATSSTASGLIVVQTSERVGAQAPAVSDTVMSVRDRADLEGRGIDVLAGKVRWPAGDPATLRLSLWDEQGGDYTVAGNKISGSYDPAGDLVVFRVDGVDANGTEVTSYGLLTVPPLADLQLTLRPGLDPIDVPENRSVTTALSGLLDVGADDRVELRSGEFPTSRTGARCEASGGDAVRYDAGSGGPWADVCRIDVRLEGQRSWTTLPVPVRIIPDTPTAELRPLTRTIAPGATETVQLADMIEWQGGRVGDPSTLRFSTSGAGGQFSVTADGSTLRAAARADATTGAQEVATISVTGAGESSAPLTLRVGESPRDLPRGGTVSLRCTVGADCGADVVGVAGEHDPFAGKSGGGLKLAAVDGGSCAVASFATSGERRVAVSWPDAGGTGGACSVGFTVRDAQGRTGTGTIEFDAQGLPPAPASIAQTGFTDTTATFTVALGGRAATPAVTGVQLSGAGSASCVPAGPDGYTCVASGLRSGERHDVTARAVNAVGESAPSPATSGWAYRAPATPKLTVAALENAGNTDQQRGGLRVTAAGSSDTREFQVSIGGNAVGTIAGPSGSGDFGELPVGAQTVVVTPVTALELPPVSGGSATGAAASAEGRVIGAPILTGATLSSETGSQSATVTTSGAGAHAGEKVSYAYAIAAGTAAPDCLAGGSSSPTFTKLAQGSLYAASACARSSYGVSSAGTEPVRIGGAIPAPVVSYEISTAPKASGAGVRYAQAGKASVGPLLPGARLRYSTGAELVLDPGDASGPITVQQCIDDQCSDAATVSWAGAPRPVTVDPTGTCVPAASATDPGALAAAVSISAAAQGSAQLALGAVTGTTAQLTITWAGDFAALAPAAVTVCVTPEPTPDP